MDDNARPHRARIVDQYLEQVGVQRLPWPACTPDLNPIEHVWDFFFPKSQTSPTPTRDLKRLKSGVGRRMAQITQDYLCTLIQSMPNRLREVIN
jgi:transposase